MLTLQSSHPRSRPHDLKQNEGYFTIVYKVYNNLNYYNFPQNYNSEQLKYTARTLGQCKKTAINKILPIPKYLLKDQNLLLRRHTFNCTK